MFHFGSSLFVNSSDNSVGVSKVEIVVSGEFNLEFEETKEFFFLLKNRNS
jgi:hypothetical protein